jgi:hypothetical protein
MSPEKSTKQQHEERARVDRVEPGEHQGEHRQRIAVRVNLAEQRQVHCLAGRGALPWSASAEESLVALDQSVFQESPRRRGVVEAGVERAAK